MLSLSLLANFWDEFSIDTGSLNSLSAYEFSSMLSLSLRPFSTGIKSQLHPVLLFLHLFKNIKILGPLPMTHSNSLTMYCPGFPTLVLQWDIPFHLTDLLCLLKQSHCCDLDDNMHTHLCLDSIFEPVAPIPLYLLVLSACFSTWQQISTETSFPIWQN